jgi:hypothetical protein
MRVDDKGIHVYEQLITLFGIDITVCSSHHYCIYVARIECAMRS